ncbi:hypothetical protein pb186bvf_004006 [Paramecium bursaria]
MNKNLYSSEQGWQTEEVGYLDTLFQGNFHPTNIKKKSEPQLVISHRIRTISMPKLYQSPVRPLPQFTQTAQTKYFMNTDQKFNFVSSQEEIKKPLQLTSLSPPKFGKKKGKKYSIINMSQLLVLSPQAKNHDHLNKLLKRLYQKK